MSNSTSSHYAQLGILSHAFTVSPVCSAWIIDSGALEHMIGSSNLFNSYTPCSDKDEVLVVDGSPSPISGGGLIVCTPTISLSSVLHIPSRVVA